MEMRKVLSDTIKKMMFLDERIVVINADLVKCVGLGEVYAEFPRRTFNVGIAEQNMACVAAGMSTCGYIPLIFSFASFATRRACDQIAVSICFAKQNVKIFGLDPGIACETNGGTHASFEDISIMRSFPNTLIFDPCDDTELRLALPEIIKYDQGTAYIRLYRKQNWRIYENDYKFNLFKADILIKGEDISIFCSGFMIKEALIAAEKLKGFDIKAEVINIHTIKPIDKDTVINSAKKTKKALVLENHSVFGGLFSAISEVLIENYPIKVMTLGIKDKFGQVGKIDFLKKVYGMSHENVVKHALNLCKKF
ncbi:MAG: transketolase alpha subunit [Candidatus Improbicoccus pseudotrichonymphae]|uniref:Transketolase alpha subunit n=1 Tax=Candidatus Improbicoccus pseudotrichonymphae TaxID=3033792 RepID=A0AA48I3F7_9FIRM|nr:MAG: transketolase alpha subunit [Candidatus Improbicoccus pseudotrichonymphae]